MEIPFLQLRSGKVCVFGWRWGDCCKNPPEKFPQIKGSPLTDGVSVPVAPPSFLQALGINIYQRLFDFEINKHVEKTLSLAGLPLFISLQGAPPLPHGRQTSPFLSQCFFF